VSVRTFLRDLARNGRLKLAAFGLALFLWVLVRVGDPEVRDLLVPVEIRLDDPGWVVMGDPLPAIVQVRFRGPPSQVFRLTSAEGISVTVPIPEMSVGEMVIPLQTGWVSLPAGYGGVGVDNIVPGAIQVSLDRLSTRSIPVRLSTRGRLPGHLALTRALSMTPAFVQVSGPASLVDGLDTLDIIPVVLSDVGEQTTVETAVDTVGLGGVTVEPYVVTMRVPAEEAMDRVFEGVRVITDPVVGSGPILVSPQVVQVTVRGARSRVSAMVADDLIAVVPSYSLQDLGELERRRVKIEVDGIPSLVFVVPGADTVEVRRRIEL
jgi:hypothetical protein